MHRSVRLTLAILIAAAAGVAARPVLAANPAGSVAVELTANRVTKSQGKEVLAPAEKAQPGETIEYRALYRNDGGRGPRRDGDAADPARDGLTAGTAQPNRVEASLDGRTFAPTPLKARSSSLMAARSSRRCRCPSTARRWALGALPSSSRTVTARVRIEPTVVAANTR
jgi:hypothetical protein